MAALLFGSGAAALVYQTAWQRELRLIFGSSTAASAAVLAIFIGGTGAGSILLGRRADASPRPLRLYAVLELAIAALTALTPPVLDLARTVYRALGGTVGLGMAGGTGLRLVLAALVVGAPTALMGGTLPAAARSVAPASDARRRLVGLLYAANTLGAVLGCTVSTFFMFEALGTRRTLWAACAANALIALLAWAISSRIRPAASAPATATATASASAPASASALAFASAPESAPALPPRVVLAFAATSGFVFFWMELVWYRMLGPLLGGTVYTFGLILAVALLGIGLGGIFYSLIRSRGPATAAGLALTCALEALGLAIPFALGDRIALLALGLRPDSGSPLLAFIPGWLAVAAIAVLPASLVAGAQYPLLIALLGTGREQVGRHVGLAAACNTLGAMAGALLGGFVLLPSLSATGSWRAIVLALIAMGVAAWAHGARPRPWPALRRRSGAPVVMLAALAAILATGPTAAWRHSPIGAGRVDPVYLNTPAFTRSFLQIARMAIVWQAEGVESSVAIDATDSIAMVVNGKVDGNARGDASTQIMGGLIGAILHPAPQSAMVIGFGTGSSAGWLGAVPSIERVDVAELEPAMREMGVRCAPINHDPLNNPRIHLHFGDAREILPTLPRRYDIIFSEPSNPYRAGVASLFTREYYQAARERLAPGGLFLQWVQSYEVDVDTLRTIYASVGSVFPSVETWYIGWSDLVLVASEAPVELDAPALRARLRDEPFRSALAYAWRTEGLEGLLAHHVAPPGFVDAITRDPGQAVNTDDRNRVEFGFARQVGGPGSAEGLFTYLRKDRGSHITLQRDDVDWARVEDEHIFQTAGDGTEPSVPEGLPVDQEVRAQAAVNYVAGNIDGALAKWRFQERPPSSIVELALVAEGLANAGDEAALPVIEQLARTHPIEARAHRARLKLRQGDRAAAAALLAEAFRELRSDPWSSQFVMSRAVELAKEIALGGGPEARSLFEAFDQPFSILLLETSRKLARVEMSRALPDEDACVRAWQALEPSVPWDRDMLDHRRQCYARWNHPLARKAAQDLDAFDACEGWRGWVWCL